MATYDMVTAGSDEDHESVEQGAARSLSAVTVGEWGVLASTGPCWGQGDDNGGEKDEDAAQAELDRQFLAQDHYAQHRADERLEICVEARLRGGYEAQAPVPEAKRHRGAVDSQPQ